MHPVALNVLVPQQNGEHDRIRCAEALAHRNSEATELTGIRTIAADNGGCGRAARSDRSFAGTRRTATITGNRIPIVALFSTFDSSVATDRSTRPSRLLLVTVPRVTSFRHGAIAAVLLDAA